jgi:heme-degrading monooxygenase HmoA
MMYARAVNVPFQPGKIDEAIRIVKDSIVPAMEGLKGFKGQLLLTQSDTGKAISINLWETEADLTAFETSPLYKELMGKLGGVLAGPPAGERYQVSVQA